MATLLSGAGNAFASGNMPDPSATPAPEVTPVSGGVDIGNPTDEPVEAYVVAITGRVVSRLTVEAGDKMHVELQPGIYVVKTGDTARRIAVR